MAHPHFGFFAAQEPAGSLGRIEFLEEGVRERKLCSVIVHSFGSDMITVWVKRNSDHCNSQALVELLTVKLHERLLLHAEHR